MQHQFTWHKSGFVVTIIVIIIIAAAATAARHT